MITFGLISLYLLQNAKKILNKRKYQKQFIFIQCFFIYFHIFLYIFVNFGPDYFYNLPVYIYKDEKLFTNIHKYYPIHCYNINQRIKINILYILLQTKSSDISKQPTANEQHKLEMSNNNHTSQISQEEQQLPPIVLDIKENPQPTRMESLCVACHQSGETILLLTKIPFFKEMLIGSFSCDHCGNRNNEVQFVGELPPRGVSIRFKVAQKSDLGREIVKSEYASIKFEELGLEIPISKRAEITTVEGILLRVEQNLEHGQEQRKVVDHESYEKINEFIHRIRRFRQGVILPFFIVINDPSGNSNVKNPFAPKLDDRIFISYFTRTKEDLEIMGYNQQNAEENAQSLSTDQKCSADTCEHENTDKSCHQQQDPAIKKVDFTKPVTEQDFMHHEPSVFETLCHACSLPGLMRMCQTSIPHFTDLIIMSFTCDFCGAHSTETKNSGIITTKSTTIVLNAASGADLKRDLFKSQTCRVKIPEIELQLDYGTLGGVFTTVQGLVEKITNHMQDLNTYTDSDDDYSKRMRELIQSLQDMMSGKKKFTLILEDPLSNSFLSNPFHPAEDQNAKTEVRDRTEEEIDYLGLNQMEV